MEAPPSPLPRPGVLMYSTPAQAIAACPPPSGRLGLALPDGTRPVALSPALFALEAHLSHPPTTVIGLGLHRRMAPQELVASPFPLLQHDPDDCDLLGEVDGVPCGISRHFRNTEGRIGIGVVELHQYAGFSGGHKAVAVGCGSRGTLDALHHRDRVTAPGVEIGRLEGNPFRETVDRLGGMAGCVWTLVQAGESWLAGPPERVVRQAAASLDCWETVDRSYPAAVLEVPSRKAVNFYQASRAATYVGLSPRPPLLPGATLFLEASCPEGMGRGSGEEAFTQVLRAGRAPWGELLTGPAPTGAGTQRAVMLALLLQRYRLVVCGVQNPQLLQQCGLEATRQPARELAPSDALHVRDPFHRLPCLP